MNDRHPRLCRVRTTRICLLALPAFLALPLGHRAESAAQTTAPTGQRGVDAARSPATGRIAQRIERLLDGADLTADQRRQIDAIAREAQAELLGGDAAPRDVIERATRRASALLTPAQRSQLRSAARNEPLVPAASAVRPATRPTTTAASRPAADRPSTNRPSTDRPARRSGDRNRGSATTGTDDAMTGDAMSGAPAMGDAMTGDSTSADAMTGDSMTGAPMMGDDAMVGDAMMGGTPKAAAKPGVARPSLPAKPTAARSAGDAPAVASVKVGDRLPDFTLDRTAGKAVTFESLTGKPAVLVFGSYSSPAFRDQLPRIADLSARYGTRASFVIVYTREMFPAEATQPERNLDDKISLPGDRTAAAKFAAERSKIGLPIAIDADDRLTNAVGGFPNAAVIVDAKGTIVARYEWAEPFAIKRQLDALLARK